jgi:alkylated DNA repair protein alkB family protein 6
MNLFDKGLSIITDFITEEEQAFIVSNITPSSKKKNTKRRNSILRYGSSKPYPSDMESVKMPAFLDFVVDRLVDKNILKIKPNHVTVNEYLTGQGLSPHIDSDASGEVITILSLLSPAVMVFKLKSLEFSITVPERSLLKMEGEARYKWQHKILPVKDFRYSLVFRHG